MKIQFSIERSTPEEKAAKLQRKAERIAKWQEKIDSKRAKLAAKIAGKQGSSNEPRS